MVAYFAARAIAGVEYVSDGIYRRTIVVDRDPAVIELTRGDTHHVVLRGHLVHSDELINRVDRARRIFNLDADMVGAVNHLHGDPVVGRLVQARPGIRVPGAWDPFEIGVRGIIGQQVTVAGANTLIGRLVARHGEPVPSVAAFGLTHLFPSAITLADADLDGLGLVPARAQAIRTFARAVADDAVRLDRSVDLDHLVESLAALPGLGPWTAHYIALRLGERDAFPASDLGLRRAVDRENPVSAQALTALAESWRPWRALAAAHLWMSHG